MKREKKLLKNTLILSIAKICTQSITFFLLPLYTGVLSTSEYGTIDLFNTLLALLLPIVTFQIEQATFRNLIESRNKKNIKKQIITNSFITILFQCLLFAIIYLIISPFIKTEYKIFLLINLVITAFSSLFLQIARGLGENTKYAIANIICTITTITFNILFLVIFKYKVRGMLLSIFIGQFITIFYLTLALKIYRQLSFKKINLKIIKKLLKYSIPLVPNSISWWIFNASDRIIVSIFLGLSFTGILSSSNKFSSIFMTLFNVFNLSWTESISLHIKDKDISDYFNNMLSIIIKFFSSVAMILLSIIPFIYPIMININYSSGYNLIPILIISSLFNIISCLLGSLYVAYKDTKDIAKTSIISSILNIIIHLLLIKYIGLYAAVISTIISFLTIMLFRLFNVKKKYFKINLNKRKISKTIFIISIIIILYYINNLYLNILSLILSIYYSITLNKKIIMIFINKIKKLIKIHKQKVKK